jgi:hypothetical protein
MSKIKTYLKSPNNRINVKPPPSHNQTLRTKIDINLHLSWSQTLAWTSQNTIVKAAPPAK